MIRASAFVIGLGLASACASAAPRPAFAPTPDPAPGRMTRTRDACGDLDALLGKIGECDRSFRRPVVDHHDPGTCERVSDTLLPRLFTLDCRWQ